MYICSGGKAAVNLLVSKEFNIEAHVKAEVEKAIENEYNAIKTGKLGDWKNVLWEAGNNRRASWQDKDGCGKDACLMQEFW